MRHTIAKKVISVMAPIQKKNYFMVSLSLCIINSVYARLEQRCGSLNKEVACIFKDPSDNVYDIPSNNGEIFHLVINNSTINFDKNIFHNVENLTTVEINYTDVNGMEGEGTIFGNFTNLFYLMLKNNKNWDILKPNTFLGPKKLETLIIDSNNIKEIQSGCFNNLSNLHVLQLTNNNFKILPDFVFSSNNDVTSLFINNNNIETLEEHSLEGLNSVSLIDLSYNNIRTLNTNVFYNLKKLEHLYLSYNSIQSIAASFQMDNLKYLYLDHNLLEMITPIFDSEDLSLIDLSFNKIRQIEPSSFYSLRTLKTLSLKNNNISTIYLSFENVKYRPENIKVDKHVSVRYL